MFRPREYFPLNLSFKLLIVRVKCGYCLHNSLNNYNSVLIWCFSTNLQIFFFIFHFLFKSLQDWPTIFYRSKNWTLAKRCSKIWWKLQSEEIFFFNESLKVLIQWRQDEAYPVYLTGISIQISSQSDFSCDLIDGKQRNP